MLKGNNTIKKIFSLFILINFFLQTISAANGNQIGADRQKESTKDPDKEITLVYKENYELIIFPTIYNIDKERKYLKNIFETTLIDQIRMIRKAYVVNPEPVEITYPLKPIYKNSKLMEDPKDEILSSYKKTADYFPLTIRKENELPKDRRLPRDLWRSNVRINSLDSEKFYLFMTLKGASAEHLEAGVYLYRGPNRILKSQEIISAENIPSEVALITAKIRKILAGPSSGHLSVNSYNQRASVYIDGIFLGKTPLYFEYLPAGEHNLSVLLRSHEKWEKGIFIDKDKTYDAKAKLMPTKRTGKIKIVTTPANSIVYVDLEYQGKSPVEISNLSKGTHSIHAVQEGYVDAYRAVEIGKNQKGKTIHLRHRKGNSDDFYKLNPKVLGPLTNEHLYKYTALISGAFALTGLYFLVQQQNTNAEITAYYKNKGGSLTSSESTYIDGLRGDASTYETYSNIAFVSSGVSLLFSIFFLTKYINSFDPPIAASPLAGNQTGHFFIKQTYGKDAKVSAGYHYAW